MQEFIMQNAPVIRGSIFIGLFLLFTLWEIFASDHKSPLSRLQRWPSNLLLVLLNNFVIYLVFPMTAIHFAELAQSQKWGILSIWEIPMEWKIVIAIIVLDFIIYVQHVLFHSMPMLWKLHRMHHQDLELDVTSGTRFHPIEIILSTLIKFTAIFTLGAPPVAVFLFEVILNAMAMFNHSNIRIPESIDSILRFFVVTPAMHRIHHSIHRDEHDTNYGSNLSIWDRILGTYQKNFQGKLVMGLSYFREISFSRLDHLLLIPFKDENKNSNK
jgi:sterol desaturase/sphingolipid hydroxylase (fatty acid hydroxylase superfamily)